MSEELTELHPTTPLPSDPLIHQAIGVLRQTQRVIDDAITALQDNCRYNENGIEAKDYFPNGIRDHVSRVNECMLRTHVRKTIKQARDVAGYAAIWAAWETLDLPESVFVRIVNELYGNLLPGRTNDEAVHCHTGSTSSAG